MINGSVPVGGWKHGMESVGQEFRELKELK